MNSINHHYIPQFYLKGFVSDCGILAVYDKKFGVFKKDRQTPKTVFFSKRRNTIEEMNGIKPDIIEELYGIFDNKFAEFFNQIRNGLLSTDDILSDLGLRVIKIYIAIQFWRLPIFDSFSENYVKNLDLKKFGKRITINGLNIGEIDWVEKFIRKNHDSRHYFRSLILPFLQFNIGVRDNERDYWNIYDIEPDDEGYYNLLCSDNPIVAENIIDIFNFKGKFIFPLSKTKLLVFNEDRIKAKRLGPAFSVKLSMITYAQANRYIAGANNKYISKVINLFHQYYGFDKVVQLKYELFSHLKL